MCYSFRIAAATFRINGLDVLELVNSYILFLLVICFAQLRRTCFHINVSMEILVYVFDSQFVRNKIAYIYLHTYRESIGYFCVIYVHSNLAENYWLWLWWVYVNCNHVNVCLNYLNYRRILCGIIIMHAFMYYLDD